jgi:hypothetical protein
MNAQSQDTFATRGLSVLQSLGGWVAIHPEQTYVATSIRGLGTCKSTFCPAERRETLETRRSRLVPLFAALALTAGVLSACAGWRPASSEVTGRGRFVREAEECQADCQNRAAPVTAAVVIAATTAAGDAEALSDAGQAAEARLASAAAAAFATDVAGQGTRAAAADAVALIALR